jgi:hypothetical protein
MSADIGNIKVGQAPAGVKPSAPTAPGAPSAPAPSISIPSVSSKGMAKKLIYGLITIAAIGIFAYIFLAMVGGGSQEATPTPSPSVSASASPVVKLISSYFGNPGSTINLPNPTTATDDFLSALVTIQPSTKQATVVTIQHVGATTNPLTFLTDVIGSVPASLSATFASDWLVLVYGQTEHFNASGVLDTTNTSVAARPVIFVELSDASTANQAIQSWESSGLAASFAKLFKYTTSKQLVTGFSSGTYRQMPVRYQNFPYADQSLDYAIVTASNNKNYLTIASSRESLFFAIDQLMQ